MLAVLSITSGHTVLDSRPDNFALNSACERPRLQRISTREVYVGAQCGVVMNHIEVTVRFASASPFGEYTFTTQFVRPGGPPSRAYYVFAPLVAKVSIRPAQRADDRVAVFLVGLGVLSAGVIALTLILSRRRDDTTPSGS